MDYLKELEAIQRWIKSTAGLNSVRLKEAPPKLPRPVILWENPNRRKDRNITQYAYVMRIQQYGRLFATDLENALDIQEKLNTDLESRNNILPVYVNNEIVAYLKAVKLEFNDSDTMDIPFTITYEATYTSPKPAAPPAATTVVNKVITGEV